MWPDRRLILPDGNDRVQLNNDDVWTPQLDYYNSIGKVESPATKLALMNMGGITVLVQTSRFFATFASRIDGRFFPYDKQRLSIVIEVFGNPAAAVAFDPSDYHGKLMPGLINDNWYIDDVDVEISKTFKVTGRAYSRLTANVLVRRKWTNEIFVAYVPVTILLCLAYASLFIDPVRRLPAAL
jgi:hypothetical protein